MPKMTEAKLNSKQVDIESAVDLRDDARKQGSVAPDFKCIECNKPVRPHRAGGKKAAHFEHLDRNAKCSKSHKI